jgi:hypothetical protein
MLCEGSAVNEIDLFGFHLFRLAASMCLPQLHPVDAGASVRIP